jgi:hypothetical protein
MEPCATLTLPSLGRDHAVDALVELAELLTIPVLESAAFCMNFPG